MADALEFRGADEPVSVADVAGRVADAVLARETLPCGRRVVAVDGRSGSGKSTLADAVTEVLARRLGEPVGLVRVDDLYPGWDGLDAAVPRLVDGVLAPLAAGSTTGRLRRWDWTADRDGEVTEIPLHGTTVVEGVGSGAAACRPYLTLLVWVEAPDGARRARALARDGETYAPHWQRWADQEEVYLAREHPRAAADVVVELR